MKEVRLIQKMAIAANRSRAPDFDPVNRVIGEIRRREQAPFRMLGVLTTFTVAAAVALGFLGLQAWQTLIDPLNAMLTLTNWVTL